ncbi:hypothetical protein [Xanthobacter sp.]|uniref:hypothetical protein n=1 Tax=Xanthobacter sp. TaxID=35809 RepID=UPI0025E0AB75|nr:hypothetical protein [Xanthobacter sp.]
MTTATPIATLAGAISELSAIRDRVTAERKGAEARFDVLSAPTVAEAMADPEALAAHHLARCAAGLTTAEAAEDAIEEAIGRLEAELLALPSASLSDLAEKVRTLERLAAAGGIIEPADLAALFADVHRLAEPP